MKTRLFTVALLTGGTIAAGTASALNWNPQTWLQKTPAAAPATQVAPLAPSAALADKAAPVAPTTAPNYKAIVQRYGPAVVGITTEGMSRTAAADPPEGLEDDPFFRFFRGIPGFDGRPPRGEVPVHGLGSGFIVRKDGLILTNAHVVRDAEEVMVKLADRREFKARVLGSDTATDVAVIKIDADNLPVVAMGNPSTLSVGDYVLAIGSPFGFERSATAGIVSATGRSLPGDAFVPFIQTDVAVNPGNSGGPLFDANGAVVGINSQIYSRTGGYQGVSFAIPIDVALRVQEQIVAHGRAVHPRLGVSIQEVNQALAESFRLEQPGGALVAGVEQGSAAARAGLQAGDVILKYNGQPIDASGDLPAIIGAAKPGDKAMLSVWRHGKTLQLTATLTEAHDKVAADDGDQEAPRGRLGLAAHPLTPAEKREAGLSSGVVVDQVGGVAARAGVQPGDVILSVNGTPVQNLAQLRDMVDKERRHIALLIQRGDARIFVPVRLG